MQDMYLNASIDILPKFGNLSDSPTNRISVVDRGRSQTKHRRP